MSQPQPSVKSGQSTIVVEQAGPTYAEQRKKRIIYIAVGVTVGVCVVFVLPIFIFLMIYCCCWASVRGYSSSYRYSY